ncbi:hydrophobin family protein [Aspergillus lucknowensis]|uniref:Hydrophobin n=1 Tax=Aspergillus lucknowensis TaxID=176173 RepID=A0ABR4LDS9_9EURO
MHLLAILTTLPLLATSTALPNAEKPFHAPPIPNGLTVKEGSSKCGDQAQLSCCNKALYGGDSTAVNGLLSNILGAGSAAEGAGLFSECAKLNLDILGLSDILNQQCKQNIVCCAESPGSADADLVGLALPCVALGSIL